MPQQYSDNEKQRRLEDKLDRISEKISAIDVTLASQHQSLVDHMRRTEILEGEIKPVRRHVTIVQGSLALVGALASIIGLIAGAAHLVSSLKGIK